jgi:hypothetical protein
MRRRATIAAHARICREMNPDDDHEDFAVAWPADDGVRHSRSIFRFGGNHTARKEFKRSDFVGLV